MDTTFDDAIVGAGIIGLAHAYALAKRGRRVIVFERHPRAQGASVRNFGTRWPIGQAAGKRYQLARRSLELWRTVLAESGIWHDPSGSLHVAYHEDEVAVLEEFLATASPNGPNGYECKWFNPQCALQRARGLNPEDLRGALYSPTEICVDPREVLSRLPHWLHPRYGVQFEFGLNGLPLLDNCMARFQCRKRQEYEGGDHVILIGEVLAYDQADRDPLIYSRGAYQA